MASSRKKVFWILLVLLLVSGAGVYAYVSKKSVQAQSDIVTAKVERSIIEDVVTAQGTLEPKDYVDVGVQVSGQLKKLYVDIGDTVKTGDLLAELDPQSYESKVRADEASIKALEAQLEQQVAQVDYDRLQYDRSKTLLKTKAVSKQELEEKEKILKVSEATIKALEAQISQAEANLETDKIDLGYTKIFAPMDGIVADKTAEEGETLNANQTTPTILQIANLAVMTVSAQVAEADIMRLKPGIDSEFVTLGSSERKWKGKIRQILPTPEVVNDVVLYDALIDVENDDRQLMNGMSTQNTFIVGRAEKALLVPMKALGERVSAKDDPEKGEAYRVKVVNANHKAEERLVYIGLMTRTKAEVVSGLSEGEVVLVSGELSPAKQQDKGPPMPGVGRL